MMLGVLNQNAPVFPLPPSAAPPGTGANTSPGTLHAGASVELLSKLTYAGYNWVRLRILDGDFHAPFLSATPRPTTGWFLDTAVTWSSAPHTAAHSAASTAFHALTGATGMAPTVRNATTTSFHADAPASVHSATSTSFHAKKGSTPMTSQLVQNVDGTYRYENVTHVGSDEVDVHNSDGSVTSYFGDGSWRITKGSQLIRKGSSDPNGNWTKLTGRPIRQRGTVRQPTTVTPAPAPQKAWYTQVAGDGLRHAYRTANNKNLGIYVGNNRVVQPANGGRLWALYDITPLGTLDFINKYGSVGGAPPPPNAGANDVVAAPAPTYVAPPPTYVAPAPSYAPPTYVTAPPVFAPAPTYMTSPPAYAPPVYAAPAPIFVSPPPPPPVMVGGMAYDTSGAPLAPGSTTPDGQWTWNGVQWVQNPTAVATATAAVPQIPGVPTYDPTTAALYAGAAYGAEAAAQSQPQPQYMPAAAPAVDPLAASIMSGGGTYDMGGDFSGMIGGFDPTTLAMLSGGSSDSATMMAMTNGGYDPTMGGLYG